MTTESIRIRSQVRNNLATLLGLLISGLALIWLGRTVAWAEVVQALGSVQLSRMWAMPALLLLSFLLRAIRWQALIEHDPPVRLMASFRALMMGYLFNTLLPARAGDLVRTLELARTQHMSRTKVLATLVTEKIVDLSSVLVLLSMVLVIYPALPQWLSTAGIAIASLTGTLVVLTFGLHISGPERLAHVLKLIRPFLPQIISVRLEPMMRSGLQGLGTLFRPSRFAIVTGLTGMIWAVEVVLVYQVAKACSVDLSLGNALFVLLVLATVSMVPAAPGMIGTYEMFGLMALRILGEAEGSAVVLVVTLHVITIAGAILIGLVCMATRPPSQAVASPQERAS